MKSVTSDKTAVFLITQRIAAVFKFFAIKDGIISVNIKKDG